MKNEKFELLRKVLKIRGYSESSISNYVSALNKYISCNGFNLSDNLLTACFREMRLKDYATSTLRIAYYCCTLSSTGS